MKEPHGEIGRRGSLKPFLYAVLGGVCGFVVGVLVLAVTDGAFGGGSGMSKLVGVLSWGFVILGAVQGYRIGAQQVVWDIEKARRRHEETH